jgi:hypothetical protein
VVFENRVDDRPGGLDGVLAGGLTDESLWPASSSHLAS